MIRSFVEMMLGDFGRQLLYFYEANSCVINSVIFTYGLFMLLSWNNLVRVYRFLVIEVAKTVHLDEDLNRKSTTKKVQKNIVIPWEKAIQVSPFPFMARIGAIFPKRMSVENLQSYFDEKDIVENAIKLLKGENIRRITPSSQRIMRRERDRKTEEARSELKKPE
jgi:hypothetical protein